ncbi:Carbon-nitrogen hydrolase [Aspergillus parasiticus SU-1]|uniref:Carbon-nitrogen hydrolase n=1 Tax=Aspergillus parasiticus (strain ATCC 56775 / NRRL 5862 / SRRC 143 / SU-1) TaxID=1403190 RepID=A0A0F0IJP0_ASPPU|nr:Carbon-nitrogen hydrolase [Aspergillus parasiticus SU-1]
MVKIALIQLHPEPHDIENNHARAKAYIQKASQAGADLAVLPEFHLADFHPTHDATIRQRCKNYSTHLTSYRTLAKECNINIVPGSIAELHTDPTTGEEKLLNVTYFIDNTGEIRGRYEKRNLWIPEREFVDRGATDSGHVAFDTPLGKVGLLICWDLAFPEAFRELVIQGAKMVIVPAYWKLDDAGEVGRRWNPESERVFVDAAVVSRAFENTAAVVFCNVGGREEEGYAGASQVAVPFLGCVGRVEGPGEGMSVVEVDMGVLDEAEGVYKVREDLGREDWHYGYKR